jgi:arsenate reductase
VTIKPTVLFVCLHNAGRSQMAAGWLKHLASDCIDVRSAGSEPADQINPVAVQAMREVDIDITGEQPKILTIEAVSAPTSSSPWAVATLARSTPANATKTGT